jgi:hypothetical protein
MFRRAGSHLDGQPDRLLGSNRPMIREATLYSRTSKVLLRVLPVST